MRQKVLYLKKKFNRLTRKKHRIYKNKILNHILDSEPGNPAEFWKSVDKLKKKVTDPSSNISGQQWLQYFKDLMNINYTNKRSELTSQNKDFDSRILNYDITAEEVLKAVKSLKSRKACGLDGINNEMLKLSCSLNVDIYVHIFNLIFKSEYYPSIWRNNYIKPIFKGGCFNSPTNYRGIAISSCFSKFFAKILHNRLDSYLEDNNIIHKTQIGFRKGCRTSDHILTLKTIIDKAFRSSKQLYGCFVDLKKAFDTVNREALLVKFSWYGITGNFFNILKNMYKEVNFSVKLDEGETQLFSSNVGVKQGGILSPTLFSIYLNDFVSSVDVKTCSSPSLDGEYIPCLLYADDIVLLSESAEGLQKSLQNLHQYCNKWDLKVNIEKTKIIVFNKSGRMFKNMKFYYNGELIECSSEYKYLGVIFKPSGSFSAAYELLCKKASKAIFSIRKLLLSPFMNVKVHLKLFDSCVKPILLYCSEILSLDFLVKDKCNLEEKFLSFPPVKVQLKFYKYMLGVNRRATNLAVFSELGTMPLAIDALKLSIGSWCHVLNADKDVLAHLAYKENIKLKNSYASKLKLLFYKLGFNHTWENQTTFSKKRLVFSFGKKMYDCFCSYWNKCLHDDNNKPNGNKLRTYRKLKSNYEFENFLLLDLEKEYISNFIRVRISNSYLLIEQGRHRNISLKERICPLCKDDIEDEFHFIMQCSILSEIRQKLFDELSAIIPHFQNMSNFDRFKLILSSNEFDIMKLCVQAVNKMYSLRKQLK